MNGMVFRPSNIITSSLVIMLWFVMALTTVYLVDVDQIAIITLLAAWAVQFTNDSVLDAQLFAHGVMTVYRCWR